MVLGKIKLNIISTIFCNMNKKRSDIASDLFYI